MSKSKWQRKAEDLNRQLENEKRDHARTRNQLQAEITRIWRLVPTHYINLMGAYPPLRKLLHVLAEAADLQDPSRGAPVEDTMRVEYIATGDRASTSQTERGVLTHMRARSNVRLMVQELEHLKADFTETLRDKTHWLAKLTEGEEWEYEPPNPPVCWRKGCSRRGRQQPYSAWWSGCDGCGRSFEMERTG